LELVRRPSYTSRYRTVRSRYPSEGTPQRRTIVRRAPETIITEGNRLFFSTLSDRLILFFIFSSTIIFFFHSNKDFSSVCSIYISV